MTIGKGGERRHLANQAIGLFAARFRVKDIFCIRIERGKRGNRRNQHSHGMGVVMKTIEKFLDAFVNKSVMCDVVGPVRQLGFVGEFAVKNKVGGFDVGTFLR